MPACPRCGRSCATAHCPDCALDFVPGLAATPLLAGLDDERLQAEIIGAVGSDVYRIDGLLATGGMGIVMRGHRVRDALPIVVKAPRRNDANTQERFTREARALATCDHPYLPRLHDIDASRSHLPLIVMEYCPGPTLRELLPQAVFDLATLHHVIRCLVEALCHCRARRLVHRDVKPDNIIVSADRCLLIDFGLALVDANPQGGAASGPHFTPAGTLLGTPPYAAPEQLRQPSAVDHRADCYSLGMTVLEALAALQDRDAGAGHEALKQLAEACTHQDPRRRPPLDAWLPLVTIEQLAPAQPQPPAQIRRVIFPLIAGGVLAGLLVMVLLLRETGPRRLSGSIDTATDATLELRFDADGRLDLTPIGDTRLRLPGSGPWSTRRRTIDGQPGHTIPIRIAAPDGQYEIDLR